jgi:methylated-DNA-[protein]-cysteine S-methyltransferase
VIVPQDDARDAGLPVLRYVTFDTDLGRFLVSRSDAGLRSVSFAKDLDVKRSLSALTRGTRVIAVEDTIGLRRVADAIREYVSGKPVVFDTRLDLRGVSEFGRRVLDVAQRIPYGTLRSYKWVAREVGAPRAVRPVGQALARNPLPLVVPCHRVVNSDGTLGGYSGGGTDMKRRLIEIENGQIGLSLREGDRQARESIRFLLELETPEDEGLQSRS